MAAAARAKRCSSHADSAYSRTETGPLILASGGKGLIGCQSVVSWALSKDLLDLLVRQHPRPGAEEAQQSTSAALQMLRRDPSALFGEYGTNGTSRLSRLHPCCKGLKARQPCRRQARQPLEGQTMTPDAANPVEVLSEEECWGILLGATLGRLALSIANVPEIYPINFVAHDGRILIRTNPGEKLFGLTINENVALETDGTGRQSVWSVVVKGKARQLKSDAEIEAAERIPRQQLTSTKKRVFVEIVPTSITGRRIHRGPEDEELTPSDLY